MSISRALTNHSQRVLRELETVVMSDAAYRKLRIDFDMDWVKVYADQRLQSWYNHDLVFVVDPLDRLLYASLGRRGSDPSWFNSVRPDLMPMLEVLRKGGGLDANGKVWSDASTTERIDWLTANFVERSGMFEVLSAGEKPCAACGGRSPVCPACRSCSGCDRIRTVLFR